MMDIDIRRDCKVWRANPLINPTTGKPIKSASTIHSQLELACTPHVCKIFERNRNIHPVTRTTLNIKAKQGVFAQLNALCRMKAETDKSKIIATASPNLTTNQRNLKRVLKKHIHPLLNKGETFANRIKYYDIITNYIKSTEPCITQGPSKSMVIMHKKTKIPLIAFDGQIGSVSKFGVAYLNSGFGFGKLLKFSCKLYKANTDAESDIGILETLTEIVKKGKFPNFPMMYKALHCKTHCKVLECPDVTRQPDVGYFVVISELADTDMETWIESPHSNIEYESVATQIVLTVCRFHTENFVHMDLHLGNLLVHKVKAGGYWHYKVLGRDVYVPNVGYLVVLWDFDKSHFIKVGKKDLPLSIMEDYSTPINLMYFSKEIYKTAATLPFETSAFLDIANSSFMHYEKIEKENRKNKVFDADTEIDAIKHYLEDPRHSFTILDNRPAGVINDKPYIAR